MSSFNEAGYAGDVGPRACLDTLQQDQTAQLVDVRTTAEWAYVGLTELSSAGKEPIRVEWQVFPSMTVDAEFTAKVAAALAARHAGKEAPLYFLCRSGVRSKAAAKAMTAAGYTRCFNVAGGFEGPPDPDGHRGRVAGWKAEGLPWTQT
jgi:rhodanese-related sulfurtransferase